MTRISKFKVKGELLEKLGVLVFEIVGNSSDKSEFDGTKVKGDDEQTLAKMVLQKKVGDSVPIKYWRNKKIKTTSLKVEAYK